MSSQLMKQSIQNSLYGINSFKINVRFLWKFPTKVQQILEKNTNVKDKNIPQSKYLGYEIIYRLPFINYMSFYNKIKWKMLIGSTMLLPTMYTLSQMGIVPAVWSAMISSFACSSTVSLYITGKLCDNQIGIIYYKDDKTIKIAYVDIWGKRVDINTSVEDIKSLTDTPITITDRLYRTVHLTSLKYPLKLVVKNCIVFNKDRLISVLGDYK